MTLTKDLELSDFKEGDQVLYVPYHAHGDRTHKDCEPGVVTSVSDKYVFARFKGWTSQSCNPDQLVKR